MQIFCGPWSRGGESGSKDSIWIMRASDFTHFFAFLEKSRKFVALSATQIGLSGGRSRTAFLNAVTPTGEITKLVVLQNSSVP
jgi:hypothetical protein